METVNYVEKAINEIINTRSNTLHLCEEYKSEPAPSRILQIPGLRHLRLHDFNSDIPLWITETSTLESLEIEEARSCRAILNDLWKLTRLKKLKLAYVEGDSLLS